MIILDITLANHKKKKRFIHAVEIKRAEDVTIESQLKSLLVKQIMIEAKKMAKELKDMSPEAFRENFL